MDFEAPKPMLFMKNTLRKERTARFFPFATYNLTTYNLQTKKKSVHKESAHRFIIDDIMRVAM